MAEDLSIVTIANIALSAGMDVGFNAVYALRQFNLHADMMPTRFEFGRQEEIEKLPLSHSIESARAYSYEVPCLRQRKHVYLSDSSGLTADSLKSLITEKLLEIVDGQR
jgi:hypothetical protein